MRHAAKIRRKQSQPEVILFIMLCTGLMVVFLAPSFWGQPYNVHSRLGWVYGICAAVFLLIVAAYSLRRAFMRMATSLKLGYARTWLNLHIYGGGIFLLLMFMHTGFALPHGPLAWWLWCLSLLTVISGMMGRALQRWIPKVLASGLSVEVLYDRIPDLVEQLRLKSEALKAQSEPAVQAFYQKHLAAAMARPQRDFIYFVDITGGIQGRLARLNYLHGFLKPGDAERLQQLEANYRAKLEIDAHFTLQQALRVWLYLHVPPALLLLFLVGVHVFCVIYY